MKTVFSIAKTCNFKFSTILCFVLFFHCSTAFSRQVWQSSTWEAGTGGSEFEARLVFLPSQPRLHKETPCQKERKRKRKTTPIKQKSCFSLFTSITLCLKNKRNKSYLWYFFILVGRISSSELFSRASLTCVTFRFLTPVGLFYPHPYTSSTQSRTLTLCCKPLIDPLLHYAAIFTFCFVYFRGLGFELGMFYRQEFIQPRLASNSPCSGRETTSDPPASDSWEVRCDQPYLMILRSYTK